MKSSKQSVLNLLSITKISFIIRSKKQQRKRDVLAGAGFAQPGAEKHCYVCNALLNTGNNRRYVHQL